MHSCMHVLYRTRSSADAEIARHASRWMLPVQNYFPYSGFTGYTIWVVFGTQVAKTRTYLVRGADFYFLLHYVITQNFIYRMLFRDIY